MKRKAELPELLAPAGSFECLVAAVEAGADAVYVGGKRFGARAYAKNFDTGELARALSYCHLHGVKLYVTVNTLIEDKEMEELIAYANELYMIGVDALIVADLGAVRELHRVIPSLELHASTQMSVHNTLGAEEAYRLGCLRVVPARELSLSDIKSVTEKSSAEVEVFLHGALCVSYSGQCLFSSLVGGRSGNRGECAQPCRLPYNGKYPLSLKDLSLAGHIPELIESGVASLKIEGRMKSPDYVYTVTKIYRRLLDEHRCATADEEQTLKRAFSRGGFTDGYFVGNSRMPMTGVRSEGDKQDSRELSGRAFTPRRVRVFAEAEMRLGKPSVMSISDGTRRVSVVGEIPQAAENSPLTEETVKARLAKMGNTFLSLSVEDIKLSLDEGINLAPSAINALRRSAAEAFESFGRETRDIPYSYAPRVALQKGLRTAQFFDATSFIEARRRDPEALSFFDITFVPLFSDVETLSVSSGVSIPPVIADSEIDLVKNQLKTVADTGVKYALVGNIGHIALAKQYGLEPVGDYRLNISNSESREALGELGVVHSVLSPELTMPKARDIGGSLIVYGRIPLMLTERCFMRENFGCNNCSSAALTDRRGERFPMVREFPHRNIILNSAVTYMGDRRSELSDFRINSWHFLFTVESAEEILSALRAYREGKPLANTKSIRRIGRR